jgi:hypothetical protein
MYFGTKSYLKSNRYHTAKYTLSKSSNDKNLELRGLFPCDLRFEPIDC